MRADSVRICPNCGTRNKAKWEFCARCSESLAGATSDAPAPSDSAVDDVDAEGFSFRPFVRVALGVALVVGAILIARAWAPQKVDSALFAIPDETAPVAPAPTRQAATPGLRALEEGRRLLAAGSFEAALVELSKAIEERSEDPEAYSLYAKALYASGAHDESIARFRQAAMLAPSLPRYHSDLARTLDVMGRADEAADAYDAVLRINPRDGDTLRLLAALRTKQEKPADAVPLLRRLEELRPGDLIVQQDLGYALEKSGDLPAAQAVYTELLKDYPQGVLARGRLAEVTYQQGQKQEAIAIFREGLQLTPDAPILHRGLGNLLERTGDAAAAAREYREYVRLAPGNADARMFEERAAKLEQRLASNTTSS
jgi:tetratricopeptide (TPR) repeat protein